MIFPSIWFVNLNILWLRFFKKTLIENVRIRFFTLRGGWKWRILKVIFFYGLPFFKNIFWNFRTPVKYLEKQTELNYLCLYIKKYARIKKTWKNKKALGVIHNYRCKKLKSTFGSHFFIYWPIFAKCYLAMNFE